MIDWVEMIDWTDPKLWIVSGILIVVTTFLLIYIKILLGQVRPRR